MTEQKAMQPEDHLDRFIQGAHNSFICLSLSCPSKQLLISTLGNCYPIELTPVCRKHANMLKIFINSCYRSRGELKSRLLLRRNRLERKIWRGENEFFNLNLMTFIYMRRRGNAQ